jgi:hypothetical protein
MRSITATQLTLDYSITESQVDAAAPTGSPNPTSTETLKVPSFNGYGEVYAAASRRAGRINAANIPDSEHKALLLERQLLLDKKFAGSISRKEVNRLEYVRWSLDRIEDAKYGPIADVLEHSISSYEHFSADIKLLHTQLANLQKPQRK